MIATVVFFAEIPVFEGMLVSNVQSAAVCKRVRQILVRARAGLKDVELVSGKWGRVEEGAEEVSRFGRVQGGC